MKFEHSQWGPHSETAVLTDEGIPVGTISHLTWDPPLFRMVNFADVALTADDLNAIAARVRAEDEHRKLREQSGGVMRTIEVPVTEQKIYLRMNPAERTVEVRLSRRIATGAHYTDIHVTPIETLEARAAADHPLKVFDLKGTISIPLSADSLPVRLRVGEDATL